jgi:hypothetical protein
MSYAQAFQPETQIQGESGRDLPIVLHVVRVVQGTEVTHYSVSVRFLWFLCVIVSHFINAEN